MASAARKVFACNVATEHGETDGVALSDFVRILGEHLGQVTMDLVLANNNFQPVSKTEQSNGNSIELVPMDCHGPLGNCRRVVGADVISAINPLHHDPQKLSAALVQIAFR